MSNKPHSLLNVRDYRQAPDTAESRPDMAFENWRSQFQHLAVEVGCGVGFHPIQWAKSHSHVGLIALERTKNKFQKFLTRLENHPSLTNIYPVDEDARDWLPYRLAASEISSYFFIYPNPYPKASQANKRWHRNPLMHLILETLSPEGTMTFATNEAWLHEECLLYMTDFWKMDLVSNTSVTGPQTPFLSHFEKKYLSRGETGYHLVFQKPAL